MRNAAAAALLVTAASCLTPGAAALAAPPAVSVRRADGGPVRPYQVTEFAVTLRSGAAPYANPFDPDEVRLDATARGPKGTVLRIPAYWSQPFRQEAGAGGAVKLVPTGGAAGWRVRLALPAVGPWSVTVAAHDRTGDGVSAPLPVTVGGSPAPGEHGFVRRATGAGSRRYFQFSDGAPFFLVGENVCWAHQRGLGDFGEWFPALAKAGGDYARLWMAFAPIESRASGLGRYDLANAAYFDHVLGMAQSDGIRCMLALGTYGEFNTGGFFNEGQWPANPYNAANGGPVPADKPDAFFADPAARRLYRRRLRYLIARYAAYTSLGFWEFWNEKGGPAPWFAEMAKYLKANDPYRHLVTDSYSTTGDAAVWEIPEFDLTQTHRYGDEGSIRDFAAVIPPDARDHDRFAKPHLVGEFGISWRRGDENFDPKGTGTNLHNGLWAGALSGDAGGAVIWWWDSYVQPKNLYHEFTGLSRFAAQVDWPRRDFAPLALPAVRVRRAAAGGANAPLRDLVLSPTAAWGEKAKTPVTVGRDGGTTGGPVVSTLMGPDKAAQRSVLTLNVDLPQPSRLVLRVLTVSVKANLHVTVDGTTAADFPLDASPTANPEYESTKQFPEYGNIYQAVFNKDRAVPLPAGKHMVTVENTAGDWVSIGSYTLEKAHDPSEDALRAVALQDARTGETLAWVQDPDSNWANDQKGDYTPRSLSGVPVTLPLPVPGRYRVTWWDTRAGRPLGGTVVAVARPGAPARVTSPAFTRDIALRAVRLP